MYACTFFGHRDCTANIRPILKEAIIRLITKENISVFYVGDSGNFDRLVIDVLHELTGYYDITVGVVLAYFPTKKTNSFLEQYSIYPDELVNIPRKYAISYRNNYMLKESDFVIAYATKNTGGAAKFIQKAIRQKKKVIYLT